MHERGGAKSNQLSNAIDEVVSRGELPQLLESELKATKEIGNFAAHPRKDTNSGEIFDVEPQEAEWTLDVLEHLFDYYYVKPALHERKLTALNEKLIRAGKKTVS